MQIQPSAINETEMLVVINDTQLYRQCDEEALGAAISFIEYYKDKITHFVLNGDIMDMEEQSTYAHFPEQHGQSSLEIKAGKWLISYLTELLPNAERVFVFGNHDARWSNMLKNQNIGLEEWVTPFEEMFDLPSKGWKVVPYGRGHFYRWHDRIFWHGARAGAKSNVSKQELDDAGVSVTTAHINRNMYHEQVDAWRNFKSAIAHGGFSKDNLGFVKKANTSWSQGFGVYYWHDEIGEQVYSVVLKHGTPSFIWDGKKFTGRGWQIPL
jgi:hypothetical protein